MSKAKSKRRPPRQRNIFLTILLIWVAVHGVIITAITIAEKNSRDEVTHPVMWTLFILASAADVVAAYGLWRWKKWGFYLYFGATLVTMFLAVINTGSLLAIMATLLPFAVVGYAARLQWNLFE